MVVLVVKILGLVFINHLLGLMASLRIRSCSSRGVSAGTVIALGLGLETNSSQASWSCRLANTYFLSSFKLISLKFVIYFVPPLTIGEYRNFNIFLFSGNDEYLLYSFIVPE